MKFNARLGYIVPGNFVGWRIHPIPGYKTPAIPENYTIDGINEVLDQVGISISQNNPFAMPRVQRGDSLATAVFEFEKVDRKKFRVLRYVGELQVEYKVVSKER